MRQGYSLAEPGAERPHLAALTNSGATEYHQRLPLAVAIAQLAERQIVILEVTGSIPVSHPQRLLERRPAQTAVRRLPSRGGFLHWYGPRSNPAAAANRSHPS